MAPSPTAPATRLVEPLRASPAANSPGMLVSKASAASVATIARDTLGGYGGMPLVAGVRWSFRGKDAGSARISSIRARLRTPPRGEQRGPAAQTAFRQALLGRRKADAERVAVELEVGPTGLEHPSSDGSGEIA